ncbi:TRL-like family protein [Leptospira congkakensis]|nr:TRL-like family protein [Leptospira congkakensis]
MTISSFYKTNSLNFWIWNLKNKTRQRSIRTFCFSIFFVCLTSSCASSGFGTQGLLYENQRISMMETGNPATKEGIACAKSYLGLLALGDASVETSQKSGNIREITSIELETFNFFGIYAKLCTVTKGN